MTLYQRDCYRWMVREGASPGGELACCVYSLDETPAYTWNRLLDEWTKRDVRRLIVNLDNEPALWLRRRADLTRIVSLLRTARARGFELDGILLCGSPHGLILDPVVGKMRSYLSFAKAYAQLFNRLVIDFTVSAPSRRSTTQDYWVRTSQLAAALRWTAEQEQTSIRLGAVLPWWLAASPSPDGMFSLVLSLDELTFAVYTEEADSAGLTAADCAALSSNIDMAINEVDSYDAPRLSSAAYVVRSRVAPVSVESTGNEEILGRVKARSTTFVPKLAPSLAF